MLEDAFGLAFLLLAAVALVAFLAHHWPVSAATEHALRYGDWLRARRDVPFAQRQDELTLRTAAARLRRRATEATLRAPELYWSHIDRLVKEEALQLAVRDKERARMFLDWAETAPINDILYPAARRAVENAAIRRGALIVDARTLEDGLGALRVRP